MTAHQAPAPRERNDRPPGMPLVVRQSDSWRLETVEPGARKEVEAFISRAYAAAYGARLTAFMPQLVALFRNDELLGACGLRRAADERLFLETYLHGAVECSIALASGSLASRSDIVEVGNLAVARPGAARKLIEKLTQRLLCSGERWAVFTAVPLLHNNFQRLGIPVLRLGKARAEHLGSEARRQWGRYYDFSPQVSAIRVGDAAAALGVVR